MRIENDGKKRNELKSTLRIGIGELDRQREEREEGTYDEAIKRGGGSPNPMQMVSQNCHRSRFMIRQNNRRQPKRGGKIIHSEVSIRI